MEGTARDSNSQVMLGGPSNLRSDSTHLDVVHRRRGDVGSSQSENWSRGGYYFRRNWGRFLKGRYLARTDRSKVVVWLEPGGIGGISVGFAIPRCPAASNAMLMLPAGVRISEHTRAIGKPDAAKCGAEVSYSVSMYCIRALTPHPHPGRERYRAPGPVLCTC